MRNLRKLLRTPTDVNSFILASERPQKWLGSFGCWAAARALENSIVVFKFVHGQWVFLQRFDPVKPTNKEPIPLFLKKGHFTTMDPVVSIPKYWKNYQKQDNGPAISFLGGGKKRASETGDSDDCGGWLRPQTESDWLRPPESHDTGNSHEATLNSPKSSSKNYRIRGKRTVNTPARYPPVSGKPTCVNWKCPICQREITGKAEQVASRKREHVKTRHPDHKYETVISRPKSIICETSEDIPQEQRAWQCPLCSRGLPSLPRRAAMLAVSAHR